MGRIVRQYKVEMMIGKLDCLRVQIFLFAQHRIIGNLNIIGSFETRSLCRFEFAYKIKGKVRLILKGLMETISLTTTATLRDRLRGNLHNILPQMFTWIKAREEQSYVFFVDFIEPVGLLQKSSLDPKVK